jgi:hypothetical protein
VAFSFLLFLGFLALVIALVIIIIASLRGLEFGFTLSEAEGKLAACARRRYLKWRWDFGLRNAVSGDREIEDELMSETKTLTKEGRRHELDVVTKETPATTDITTEAIHPVRVVCTGKVNDPNTQHANAS